MDQQSIGGFSCDSVYPSGASPYYFLNSQPVPFVPNNDIVSPPSNQTGNPDTLYASSTSPYYSLNGISGPAPPQPTERPLPSVVPDPALNYTNSKALTQGPYGSSSAVLSAPAGFAVSGIQYAKDSSYFRTNAPRGTAPSQPLAPEALATTKNAITVYFSVAGITGSAPITYSFLYGKTNPPTTPFPATRVSPSLSIYAATITGLTSASLYYIQAVASNDYGSTASASTQAQTPGATNPPSGSFGDINFVNATSSSIAVSVDAANVSGETSVYMTYKPVSGMNVLYWFPSTVVGGLYTFTITGLVPSTQYEFQAVATNGTPPDIVSALSYAYTNGISPIPDFTTNVVLPFLIQGPRFNTPYTQALDYYVNVDAVGCYLVPGDTTLSGAQVYGSLYAYSQVTGVQTSFAGLCTSDRPYTQDYGTVTDNYFESVGVDKIRRLISWGGYYADVLGLFGPYQPTGFPGTNPPVGKVVNSFCATYMTGTTAPNELSWSASGWGTKFDGLVLDFENVGLGGVKGSSNIYPLPQDPVPSFPADANSGTYQPYIQAIGSIPAQFHTVAPTKFLANAPVSLSINGDLAAGKNNGNIGAANTALNTWFAFPDSTTVPSPATYNATASQALNHPAQMCYFDEIFVQFYNEEPDYYLGGSKFTNVLAQWGYVAILAQQQVPTVKNTRINIGLAKGTIIPGGSPAVDAAQGPTAPLDGQTGPPYEYWYPQYNTESPPNNTTNPAYTTWPNTGDQGVDAGNLAAALRGANLILQQAFGNAGLVTSDWCSGAGFWAGGEATTMAQEVYTKGSSASPGNILPSITTYCWSDASYPSPDPAWANNLPIVSDL